MKKSELNNFHSGLKAEFKKLDDFLESFQNRFTHELSELINETYPKALQFENTNELMTTYANHIFSTAESVSDKDSSYNEVRLAEEVKIMNSVVKKFSDDNDFDPEFAERVHQKAKEIMVAFHPDLMELSANGFRLLEKYSMMYNKMFMGDFSVIISGS